MDKNKKQAGIQIKELEAKFRKHQLEVFVTLYYVIALLFTLIFGWAIWSIILATAGALVGFFFPAHVEKLVHQVLAFIAKQERITQYVLWGVRLVVAIFLSPLVFFGLGLIAGKGHSIDLRRVSHLEDRD